MSFSAMVPPPDPGPARARHQQPEPERGLWPKDISARDRTRPSTPRRGASVERLVDVGLDPLQRFLLGLGVLCCSAVFGFQGAVGDHVRSHEILNKAADIATADVMVQAAVDVVRDGN